jgi:hypothetical protein
MFIKTTYQLYLSSNRQLATLTFGHDKLVHLPLASMSKGALIFGLKIGAHQYS